MGRKQPIESQVATRVRALRQRLDMSQAELARQARTHRSQIAAIERGNRSPTIGSLEKLARALRVRLVDLVRDDYPEPAPNPKDRGELLAAKLRGRSKEFLDFVESMLNALDRAERGMRR